MSKIFIKIIIIIIPLISFSQELEIKHLSEFINTHGAELNFIQINETTAFYTSSSIEKEKYRSLIFETHLKSGEWQKGRYFHLGDSESYANISYNLNDDYVYYSEVDKNGVTKIVCKNLQKSIYKILNNKINLPESINTQPHKTYYNNNDVLYFVSDRKGGFGGMDIWFSIIDKLGNYGEPINAGERINTKFNEITPYYNVWTGELFFSSDRNEQENGIDIFKSTGSLNLWNNTERLMDLNSKYDDLYLSFYDEYSGYFSSNRNPSFNIQEDNCCNDIFYFKYPNIKVSNKTFNDTIKKHLPISLYFHNDEPNPRSVRKYTEKTYKDCYISYYKLKDKYIKINSDQDIETFFERTLKNNYNKLNLILDYIHKSLKRGNNIVLNIKGFASPLYEDQYNINLSNRRISSLMNLIMTFENGKLSDYFDSGSLKIIQLPYGENKSNRLVSDDPANRKKSIYSIGAMLERKIEIVEIVELK